MLHGLHTCALRENEFNPRRGSLCLLRNVAAEVESNMHA